jgi:hypothetical protein
MRECRAYKPRPPPLPDPNAAAYWKDLKWKLRCLALPASGTLIWKALDPPSAPVNMEVLYLHICWSLAAYWWLGWTTYFQARLGKNGWQSLLSSLDCWVTPIVGVWLWSLCNPVSATAHTQVLYVHVFGWFFIRWCRQWWNDIGTWLDSSGYKTGFDKIQFGGTAVYRVASGKQFEARGYLTAYWAISSLWFLLVPVPLGIFLILAWVFAHLSWLCAGCLTFSSQMRANALGQDKIGWTHFLEGKVTGHIRPLQQIYLKTQKA